LKKGNLIYFIGTKNSFQKETTPLSKTTGFSRGCMPVRWHKLKMLKPSDKAFQRATKASI
jgi:hypothetical protein